MFQYASTFRDATSVTSTTADANYPDDNVMNRLAPFRPWRATTNGSDQTLTYVLSTGAAVGVWGFGVWHCNAPQVKLQISTDGTTWAGLPGAGLNDLYSLARDFGVYKYFVPFASQQNLKSARVIVPASQTLREDVPFMYQGISPKPEIGTLFFPSALVTMDKNPTQAIDFDYDSGEDEIRSSADVVDIMRVRYPRVSVNFAVDSLSASERVTWENVLALGKSTPVLWFLNEGKPEAMYWARCTGQVRVKDSFDRRTINSSWRTVS